jgi:integrase
MPRPRTGGATYRRGRWYARITLSREPVDATGTRPRLEYAVQRDGAPVVTESKADEAFARRYALRLQERYDEGSWTPPDRAPAPPPPPSAVTTVASWCARWLATQTYSSAAKERRAAAATLALRDERGGCFGDLPLGSVTPRDVAAWIALLRRTPVGKRSPDEPARLPAPRTVRNMLDPVARALRAAVFEGHLGADPCAVLPTSVRPQAVDADPLARATMRLTRAELELLLGEPGIEARWSAFWHLLALTGARESEVLALRWCDLIPDTPLHRVRFAAQIHHRTRERAPTKTRAVKEVPMHPVLLAELARWAHHGWPAEYGRRPADSDLIVPARAVPGRPWHEAEGTSGPLWQQAVYRALQRDLAACCLPPHRVHDLRHSFVSLCADSGIAADVATRWTHSPTSTSARHLYLVPSWDRQCTEMMKLQITPRRPPGEPSPLPALGGSGERFW